MRKTQRRKNRQRWGNDSVITEINNWILWVNVPCFIIFSVCKIPWASFSCASHDSKYLSFGFIFTLRLKTDLKGIWQVKGGNTLYYILRSMNINVWKMHLMELYFDIKISCLTKWQNNSITKWILRWPCLSSLFILFKTFFENVLCANTEYKNY